MNDLEGLKAAIMKGDEKIEFPMTMVKVDDPPEDIVLKAKLQSANQKIFDLIQRCQKENNRQAIFEEVKTLDAEVQGYVEITMKIKDRELRRDLMDKVGDCKKRTVACLDALRKNLNGQMDNATIAQLNDVAFKGIRKAG